MADSDGEIEYLEEDAEIVQQCVRTLPKTISQSSPPRPCLMVERPVTQKRKRKDDDDSEYEPSDEPPPSPPSPPPAKRRSVKFIRSRYHPIASSHSVQKIWPQPTVQELFLKRIKCNIHIPDYEDPLCLPVRAIKADISDKKRLVNWNIACLEHFKQCDNLLKPERGVKSSVRTAVFKNVGNKETGQTETTICSKVCLESENSDKKSEIFQWVLPRYREKKVLPSFPLLPHRPHDSKRTVTEIILSKENHKDGEALVVYNPQDSVSAVYALIDKRKEDEEDVTSSRNEDSKMFIKELTACRVCSGCFQTSWRGVKNIKKKYAVCPVCGRTCISAYNLLSHFKTHSAQEVRSYKRVISTLLSEILGYHYRCRVCRLKLHSIRALRNHVKEHQGKETFTCSVCNRVVN